MKETLFDGRTPIVNQLKKYGFVKKGDAYLLQKPVADGQLSLLIIVTHDLTTTQIIDEAFGTEYTLHRVADASGAFVSSVRNDYLRIITEICDNCFMLDSFTGNDAKKVIRFVKNTYGDEPEYLWKTPDAAAIRRSDSKKWYACMMHIPKCKLGFDSDEDIEIINLHMKPEDAPGIIDNKSIFPGWHMNKKSWFTVCLDGSVPEKRLFSLIQNSYELARK